jgi:hypothetical protein
VERCIISHNFWCATCARLWNFIFNFTFSIDTYFSSLLPSQCRISYIPFSSTNNEFPSWPTWEEFNFRYYAETWPFEQDVDFVDVHFDTICPSRQNVNFISLSFATRSKHHCLKFITACPLQQKFNIIDCYFVCVIRNNAHLLIMKILYLVLYLTSSLRGNPLCWPCDNLYPQKLALTSPRSGGRSVGIVRSRTQATECFVLLNTLVFVLYQLHAEYSLFPGSYQSCSYCIMVWKK